MSKEDKVSRRTFLKEAGLIASGVGSMAILSSCGTAETITETKTETKVENKTVTVTEKETSNVNIVNDLEKAKYMLIQDATTCISCGRCELACTEYNLGYSQPSISNIKVSRNMNFGVGGAAYNGMKSDHGKYGDFRVVADVCHQCAHPVPCMQACPNGAIEIVGENNVRVINEEKCIGCGTCMKACPYNMICINPATNKARKCDLCGGSPECERVCPTGSIRMVPWVDVSESIPANNAVSGYVGGDYESNCKSCHK